MKTITAILLVLPVLCGATVLSDAAAALQPGKWNQLNTIGFGFDLLRDVDPAHILQYTDDARWDPVSKRYLFLGQGHQSNWDGDPSTTCRFILYRDSDNTWVNTGKIPQENIGHAYDHSALDPSTGDFYHRPYSSSTVYVFSASTQNWSTFNQLPGTVSNCCMAMEYFPEMKGLILIGAGEVYHCPKATRQWTRIAQGVPMSDVYQSFAEYDPVHKVIVFGGGNGSSAVNKLDSAGKVTNMKNAPIGLGIMQTVFTADPVSGRFLVFGNNVFYDYDVVTDTWTNMGNAAAPLFMYNSDDGCVGIVASPVSTYGITMFLTWNSYNSKVLIYKHAILGSAVEYRSPAKVKGPDSKPLFYDIRGKKVTAFHSPGIYLMKQKVGGKTVTKRILVQK